MKKLGLLAMVFLATLLLFVGCKDNKEPVTPPEPEVIHPRYSDIRILELEKDPGSIEVFVKALDAEAMIYVIIVAQNSAAPSHEQIKKHENYGGITIISHLEGKDTLYKTVSDLEEGKSYDIYVTLELDEVFAETMYKTTCKTKTLDETLDKGSGTPEDPYKVSTITDLEAVANSGENSEALTAYYTLENDIDLSEKYGPTLLSFVPLSWQTGSLKAFNGYFDGKGHTIKNLYINETRESVGLFGQVGEEGVVTNLILENPVVATTSQRLGAAVGYNKGTVADIFVLGGKVESLVPEGGQAKAGAIVGDMYESGSILRCASKTTVIAAGNNIGGISGSADASTGKTKALEIIDCYSLSDVISSAKSKNIGGIVGYARCINILRCYATGNIEGGEAVGGIAGFFQHRSGSPIVPSLTSCFVMGASIKVTGASQTNNSDYVIGNRSTSNNTNPVYGKLYYADSNLTGNQKTPQNLAEETSVSHFADKEWLKNTAEFDCNDVYWSMKEKGNRPTLVKATWDNGAYAAPLFINSISVMVTVRNELTLTAAAESGIIAYVVVAGNALAPTAEQILAHETYDGVSIVAYGTSENNTLEVDIKELADDTEYAVYAVAKDGENISSVSSAKKTTMAAPILLAASYSVADGKNIGEIVLTVTSNKAVTTYYYVSKAKETLTKETLMEKESSTKNSITISGLDDNTKYYVYAYSKTADEDVEVEKLEITTALDPVALEIVVSLAPELTPGALKLMISSNKANTSIYYKLDLASKTYTKEELISEGTLYENEVVLDNLENDTEYKVFVYAKTNTKETEVVTASATTINPEDPLAVEAEVEENDEDFLYVLAITTNKAVDVYYLVSTSTDAPSVEDLKALESTKELSISLVDLERGTTYYVYVYCATETEETLVMAKEFTTAALPDVTLEVELTNTRLVKYAQADATFVATEGATIHYLLSKEEFNVADLTLADLTKSTNEEKVELRGLHSATTYYLYASATKAEASTPIVSQTITTDEYRIFNRDYPTQKTINIYNAEDFYNYVEFTNKGLPTSAEEAENGTLKKASDSANVTLYGNIYLDKPVDMIVTSNSNGEFRGVFDGQGYTIYNLTIESAEHEYLGLFKAITATVSSSTGEYVCGQFRNTIFDNAKVMNTYENSASLSTAGNGIVCGELRGVIENIVIKNSSISVKQDDSRVGAIAGRFTNYNKAQSTAHVSNCAVINTTISGAKNVGGAIGYAAYSNPYSEGTRPEGDALVISDIYTEATLNVTTTTNVGGVVGLSEFKVSNLVNNSTIVYNDKARTDCMVIGTCQNGVKNGALTVGVVAEVTSCISYQHGTLVKKWDAKSMAAIKCEMNYEVASESSAPDNQSAVALEEITADWIKANTTFDIEGSEDTPSLWVLEGNQLRLRIGGNN